MAGEIKSGSEGPAGDDDEIIIIISGSVRSDRANDIVSFAKKTSVRWR